MSSVYIFFRPQPTKPVNFPLAHQVYVSSFDPTGIAPGQVVANEGKSSPSQITAMKMSTVWLHWNYTYGGDYLGFLRYNYQSITYRSRYGSTPVELARRIGASGTLSKLSSTSDPIGARIDVISNNSTLVVHHLQYNDSGSNFSSYIQMTYNFGLPVHRSLKPVATIDVKGELFQLIFIS